MIRGSKPFLQREWLGRCWLGKRNRKIWANDGPWPSSVNYPEFTQIDGCKKSVFFRCQQFWGLYIQYWVLKLKLTIIGLIWESICFPLTNICRVQHLGPRTLLKMLHRQLNFFTKNHQQTITWKLGSRRTISKDVPSQTSCGWMWIESSSVSWSMISMTPTVGTYWSPRKKSAGGQGGIGLNGRWFWMTQIMIIIGKLIAFNLQTLNTVEKNTNGVHTYLL